MGIVIPSRAPGEICYRSETAMSLQEAILEACERGISLAWASLAGLDLHGANLAGADLSGANLSWADLSGAKLSWADLFGADLVGATLPRADLSRADLSRANLSWADLSGAKLSWANLSGVDLTREQLDSADLAAIRADFESILAACPAEVPALRAALEAGQIDGSCYEGECCCLVGTLAFARGVPYDCLPGVQPDSNRPAERWFLAIRPGVTPANSAVAAVTAGWLDQWLATRSQ